jgi:hypothetical protein
MVLNNLRFAFERLVLCFEFMLKAGDFLDGAWLAESEAWRCFGDVFCV